MFTITAIFFSLNEKFDVDVKKIVYEQQQLQKKNLGKGFERLLYLESKLRVRQFDNLNRRAKNFNSLFAHAF